MVTMVMTFAQPGRLWWLLLVPALALLYLALSRRLIRPGRRLSRLDKVLPRDRAWKRHVSVGLSLMSLASLVVAFAEPQAVVLEPRERATVVIVIDVSRSMLAQDVEPDRLDAAKAAASEFVDLLPATFNISLVSFAAAAEGLVSPTTNKAMVKRAIQNLTVAPSTATGEGILEALHQLTLAPPDPDHPDDPAPGAIVLLSDGSTNTGTPSATAAEQAKEQGVPVNTIAYGTPGGYVVENGRRQPVPVDHAELARISSITGGTKFSAESRQGLQAVYETLAESIGYQEVRGEVTYIFAGIALGFALLAALGVISLAARWP